MALDFTGNDIANARDAGDQSQNFAPPPAYRPGAAIQQANPALSPYATQTWINRRTGETFQGQVAANDPTKIIQVGGVNRDAFNTTQHDINTGEKTEAMPHPGRDALLHTAMIWGPAETAGLLSAFSGGGAASSALPSATAPTVATTAPTVAATTAATGGALSAVGGVPGALSMAGSVLAGIERNRLAGRQAEADAITEQNRNALAAAGQRTNQQQARVTDQIAQKTLQINDYQRNLRNAIMAGLMDPTTGVQDIHFDLPDRIASHMPNVTGGLRPSALGNRGELAATIGPQARAGIATNPSTANLEPLPDVGTPDLASYPTTGALDYGLSAAALASGVASQLWPRPRVTPAPGSPLDLSTVPTMSGVTFNTPPPAGSSDLYRVPQAFNFTPPPPRGLFNNVSFG